MSAASLDKADELELAKAAIKAMAEDGWLFHGVEGMSESQKLCYEAYLKLGLKDGCFVYAPPRFKDCPHCQGAGIIPFVGDTA